MHTAVYRGLGVKMCTGSDLQPRGLFTSVQMKFYYLLIPVNPWWAQYSISFNHPCFPYHRLVFIAPLMNLRQLKNEVFKNSTAFKKIVNFFKNVFICIFSWIFIVFFSNLKTDQDTRTLILFFSSILNFFAYIFKKCCIEAF